MCTGIRINIYMYIYIYTRVYVYIYEYVYIYAHTHLHRDDSKFLKTQILLQSDVGGRTLVFGASFDAVCLYNWLYIHIHIYIYTYIYTYICMYVCVCIEQIQKFWKHIASGWCEGQGGGFWCCVPRHVNVYMWSRNSESHIVHAGVLHVGWGSS